MSQIDQSKSLLSIFCLFSGEGHSMSTHTPLLLKFGMFVGLDKKMYHTKFQVSNSNSF